MIRLRGRLAACLLLLPCVATAHEMSIAEMELRELSPGEFLWQWAATNDKRPGTDGLTVSWPENCAAEANVVRCHAGGLKGTMAIDGVGSRYSAALVKVYWRDGQRWEIGRASCRERVFRVV